MSIEDVDIEALEEEERARTINRARHNEDVALSESVKVALTALRSIAADADNAIEDRVEAASRILAYASEFVPPVNVHVTSGDEEDASTDRS